MTEFIEAPITGAVLRNGRLYFSASLTNFFPSDSLGGRGVGGATGKLLTIVAGADEIETDIRLSSGQRISPRASFARWLKMARAGEGDRVRIVRLSDRRFQLELAA